MLARCSAAGLVLRMVTVAKQKPRTWLVWIGAVVILGAAAFVSMRSIRATRSFTS
jgi:amino acid transporter